MIVVVGEALIDLVVSPGGEVAARPGGSPFNAARSLARLGAPTTFLARLARDGLGRLLRERLAADGVAVGVPEPSSRPSTLAVATLNEGGSADYAFYLDGSAGADLDYEGLKKALPVDAAAVHVGDLGLVMEPIGTAIERLVVGDVPADTLVLLDPNCRPSAITDHTAYRERIAAIARRADIVKASTEDLAYLYPDAPPEEAAGILLESGPSLVLVTDGPAPARAFLRSGVLVEEVPSVDVVDTIGAGDAFGGAFLAWWTAHGLGQSDLPRVDSDGGDSDGVNSHGVNSHGVISHGLDSQGVDSDGVDSRGADQVRQALKAAVAAAALTCTRPGADPPTLAELRVRNWWP